MSELITKTINFVKAQLQNAEGGHDWFHTQRVYNSAVTIAKSEPVDFLRALLALFMRITSFFLCALLAFLCALLPLFMHVTSPFYARY